MPTAPRIYNLFPPLVGAIDRWGAHLPRIAAMGFDWVYLNPFQETGGSGSLYSIKDPFRLAPWARGNASGDCDATLLRGFVEAAKEHKLKVMMDLVVNHTADDSPLVAEKPHWYRREADGSVYRARAVDPDDPSKVTIWGDLAELDYETPRSRAELTEYWARYVRQMAGLGIAGFRCDAAYQVPVEVWQALTAAGREASPGLVFAAENLGCTEDQIDALGPAGFDFFFNSAKWWDFHARWALDQYERFRHIAPSISFPESHDTPRAATEAGEGVPVESWLKFRLMFAATFASGLMIPIGYEYAFRHKLDVVTTRPSDWEETGVDLSDFVAEVNRMKQAVPALNVEGPQRRITGADHPVLALLRLSGEHPLTAESCAITLINPDPLGSHAVALSPLLSETGGLFDEFVDVTPGRTPIAVAPGVTALLEALEIRVIEGRKRGTKRGSVPETSVGDERLVALAENRVAIEAVYPEIDGGRFPAKRIVGETVEVSADIFSDGHDKLGARVKFKGPGDSAWSQAPMVHIDNDRWRGQFPITQIGTYEFTIEAWRDVFESWRIDLLKKRDAGQSLEADLPEGVRLLAEAAATANGPDKEALSLAHERVQSLSGDTNRVANLLLADELAQPMARCGERGNHSRYGKSVKIVADRLAARYSAWYELFPRSQSGSPTRHGTFDDVIARLPYVRDLGFDVLYMPPIHPIGDTNRKGRNNALQAEPSDPGSTYAIGSVDGGHTAIHPDLGTIEDFRRLVAAAHDHGMEIALDFAIQCSPDHPWTREHPEWFDWRPDGTIRFAENPPKKYEDIVNVHFYGSGLPELWYALRDVILYWMAEGVKIFRVDNPHTKPLPFWEWVIVDIRRDHPEVIFLAEAFTRPKMMMRLAKVGFSQSYTYFTWRNTKQELTQYLTELTSGVAGECYRPNFFTNTPDINPYYLQTGGRAAFVVRATLAATLSSAYGLYSGFELCESTPLPEREEYLDSEKYEIKARHWNAPGNIKAHIKALNRIRAENPALHDFKNVTFYNVFNDALLLYGKMTPDKENCILVMVNLDPHNVQEGSFEAPLWEFGLPDNASLQAWNLFTGERAVWQGKMQFARLSPDTNPCMIWRISP